MKKKVLLINPPQKYYKHSSAFGVYFPLGLLYIGAMIKEMAEVKILDCLVTKLEERQENNYIFYGTPLDAVARIIEDFKPDIVGITIPATAQASNAITIGKLCKEINPQTAVVLGGPDATVRYEFLLWEGAGDFCVIGEGEFTFAEFVRNYQSITTMKTTELPGLAYLKDSQIVYKLRPFASNLDQIPFPAYDLINVNDYLQNQYLYINRSGIRGNSISLITSRGCPYECIFCSAKLTTGKKFRAHSTGYVLRHVQFLKDTYGISNFHFEDGNASLNRVRYEEILDGIIEGKLDIRWDVPDGIRADSLDRNLLQKMKQAGCVEFTIAIESGNERVLEQIIKKELSLKTILEVIQLCQQIGLKLNSFYVIGFPGETVEEMRQTINLALDLFKNNGVTPYLTFATPYYGTELYHHCVREGFINPILSEEEMSQGTYIYGTPLIETKDFKKSDIKKLILYFLVELKKAGLPGFFNFNERLQANSGKSGEA